MIDIPAVSYHKPWLLFWITDIFAAGYFYYALYRKCRSWARGTKQPSVSGVKWWRVVRISLAEVFLQRQLFALSRFRWFTHLLIFWGFIALALLSASLFIAGRTGLQGMEGNGANLFSYETRYILIKIWGDSFGLALLIGLAAAGIRRLLVRPAQQTSNQMDLVLLVFLSWLTLSGFVLEGLRLGLMPSDLAQYSFVGRLFIPPGDYTLAQLQPWLTTVWVLHSFSGLALFIYLPHSKLLHSILAPVVITLNAVEEQGREDLYWPDIRKHRPTGLPKA
jgi:nitrate reductase gamma subunit